MHLTPEARTSTFLPRVARNGLAFFVMLFCASPTFAGICNTAGTGKRNEFQFLVGYSPGSSTVLGLTEDRKFGEIGFAYSFRCWNMKKMAISYTGTLLPVASVFQPRYQVTDPLTGNSGTIRAHKVYGISVLPLGFTTDFAFGKTVHPFIETHGGFIASEEPVPVNIGNATALNFIFDFGGGMAWRFKDTQQFRGGYRFTHISNGYTTAVNPGLDNNVLFVSWSLLR